MAETKKLSEIQPHYSDWIRDAKTGTFRGVPINTMSADDLLAVIGEFNHLLHNLTDRVKAREERNRIIMPPGFNPNGKR